MRTLSPRLKRLLLWLWLAMAFVSAVVKFLDHDGLTRAETVGVIVLVSGLVVALVSVSRVARREFTNSGSAAQPPVR